MLFITNAYPLEIQLWYFDKLDVHHVCNFALSEPTWEFSDMRFDGGPQLSLAGARTLDGTPFALSPLSDIVGISMEGAPQSPSDYTDASSLFTMIIRPGLMFDILGMRPNDGDESFKRFLDSSGSMRSISWADWGPQCTRYLPHHHGLYTGDQHIIGGHFLMLEYLRNNSFFVHIYDFRPEIVARYAQSFPQDVCTETTLFPGGRALCENISSTLPFHVAASKELFREGSRFTIDDGRIIFCNQVNAKYYPRS